MKYKFPEIRHLSDVMPAIEGRNEFVVARHNYHTIVNYNVNFEDTFPEVNDDPLMAIRRECRGIVFDYDGNILSRRLHKFFNLGEKDENKLTNLNFSTTHFIEHKLDGSMITPLVFKDKLWWATKMGPHTDVALAATEFVNTASNSKSLIDFGWDCFHKSMTPIFEFTAPSNRIVVRYNEPKLTLLAIRDNVTGTYMMRDYLKIVAALYNLDLVPVYDVKNSNDVIANLNDFVGENEGIVIAFNDGHKVKVKTDWYVNLHKAKDQLRHVRNVVQLILDGKIDDLVSLLDGEDLKYVHHVSEFVDRAMERFVDKTLEVINDTVDVDRKTFALDPTFSEDTKWLIFKVWERRFTIEKSELFELLITFIKMRMTTNIKFETMTAEGKIFEGLK